MVRGGPSLGSELRWLDGLADVRLEDSREEIDGRLFGKQAGYLMNRFERDPNLHVLPMGACHCGFRRLLPKEEYPGRGSFVLPAAMRAMRAKWAKWAKRAA